MILEPFGTKDCFFWLHDNLLFLSLDLFFKSSKISFLCSSGELKVSAITCVVISSGVGPSPPVVIRISDRLDASSIASFNLAGLSPTTVCLKCGIPKIASCSAIHCELVLTIFPRSISLPMHKISAPNWFLLLILIPLDFYVTLSQDFRIMHQ